MSRRRRGAGGAGRITAFATRGAIRMVAFVTSAAIIAACGGGSTSAKTTAAGVPSVVSGPPSRYDQIVVSAGARQAVVPATLAGPLAPLLMARDFGPQQSLSQFGLDRPLGQLVYRAKGVAVDVVTIGGTDFDRHGFYATLGGNPAVYLVLSDSVRPVLALVGVVIAAPSS